MYPPQYVYVASVYDNMTETWETRVFSKSYDASFWAYSYVNGTEPSIKEARFVL